MTTFIDTIILLLALLIPIGGPVRNPEVTSVHFIKILYFEVEPTKKNNVALRQV